MKKKPKKIIGSQKQITILRSIKYKGREMTEVQNFYGLWYYFWLLDQIWFCETIVVNLQQLNSINLK